jgi:hypothetical protein
MALAKSFLLGEKRLSDQKDTPHDRAGAWQTACAHILLYAQASPEKEHGYDGSSDPTFHVRVAG